MNSKAAWDKFTDHYSFLFIHPQYYTKRYANEAVILAEKYARGVLVDIGCGRMPYKNRLLPHVKKYIGLDHPETAKLYKGENKPDILADATNVPLKTSSCDTVLLLQVLEHLPEPEKALQEISRITKPNGVLIISTIQTYPLHDAPHDFYRFTKYGLSHLLKRSGFTIKESVERGNVFIFAFQSFNIYLMLLLKRLTENKQSLSSNKLFKLIIPIIALPVLFVTTFSNFLALFLSPLDKNSKFTIVHTVAAINSKNK